MLATIVAWPVHGGEVARARHPRRPNILLIITDDQRGDLDSLRVMPKTQRLLKRKGTMFTNAFATTPFCCPSRASIFTGRYAHNHGVLISMKTHGDAFNQRSTVQRYLRAAGYRNAYFGKYLNGWPIRRRPPHFQRWAIFSKVNLRSLPAAGYRDGRWNVNGRVRRVHTYSTTYIRRRAVRFLTQTERNDRRPWFMVLATAAPHLPAPPEGKYRRAWIPSWTNNPARRERNRSDKPPFFRRRNVRHGKMLRHRRNQLRSLRSVDDMVRAVMRKMGRLRERRNTLVIFMSDNGFLWGEHKRTRKLYPYTMSIKIPLLMRWPGHVARGVRDRRIVGNIDIAPTILHAAGITPSSPMDGRSLLGGESRGRILTEFWAAAYSPDWASTRTKTYQYTEYYNDAGDVTFREYYDLANDRWQLRNLLGDSDATNDPPDVAGLSAQLALDRECAGTEGASACP